MATRQEIPVRTPSLIRSRPGLLIAGGVLIAGVYVVLSHALASDVAESDDAAAQQATRPAGPREPPEHDPRTAVLQRRVAALESGLTELRGEREAEPRDSAARGPSDIAAPRPSASELQSQREQEETRIFAQIGRSFSAQPAGTAWSVAMTDRITEQLRARPLDNSRVENIDCRSSVCRIAVEVNSDADLATIRDSLRFPLADMIGAGATKRDETGRFIIYLAKDPRDLGVAPQPGPTSTDGTP